MNRNPIVTVVMTSYNYARFLDQAIESVVHQTRDDWTMVIVDDCSIDSSWEIIGRWQKRDERIRAIRNASREGFVAALNRAVDEVASDFIAVIDSDDVWLPERLEKQLAVMLDPLNRGIGVCGTNCLLVEQSGKILRRKEYPLSDAACRRALWYRNPFCHSATLIRTECFHRYGLYDERFPMAQDLNLWFRFGQGYDFRNLPDFCVHYRVSGENASLRWQRELIRSTIHVRRWAASQYGYPMSRAARAGLALIWCVQWLPPTLVHELFHRVWLRCGKRLWRESGTLSRPTREGRGEGTRNFIKGPVTAGRV